MHPYMPFPPTQKSNTTVTVAAVTLAIVLLGAWCWFLTGHPTPSMCGPHETEAHGVVHGGGQVTLCIPK